MRSQLPYFDFLLQALEQDNTDIETAFGRHVHWGYWANPQQADGTFSDFAQAAENLTRLLCDAAQIQPGMAVLDCGCGFGGTLASLNERHSPIQLTGLNIDPRQLDQARQRVQPRSENTIDFVQGDACVLPFPDHSFDVVTAVECIFHFPSRAAFFSEAARVLKPGGKLALSDFITTQSGPLLLPGLTELVNTLIMQVYGEVKSQTAAGYASLAEDTGFRTVLEQDITAETLPTFTVLEKVVGPVLGWPQLMAMLSNKLTEVAQRSRLVLYEILVYEASKDRSF